MPATSERRSPPEDFEEQTPSDFRIPPQNMEAEVSVLGAMMLEKEACEVVSGILKEGDFYREAHQILYIAIQSLRGRGEPVDVITLSAQLRLMGHMETVGGISALTTLIERVPTAANAEHYAYIVRDKALSRRLIRVGAEIIADAYSDQTPIQDLMTTAVDRLEKATNLMGSIEVDDGLDNVVDRALDRIERIQDGDEKYYISSGYSNFDAAFGGWERGKLYVVRGKAKRGKTLLVHNSALQMAANQKTKVGYCFIDRDKEEMINRTFSLALQCPMLKLLSHDMTLRPPHLRECAEALKQLPFRLVGIDDVSRDPRQVFGWIRRAVAKYELEAVFLDSFSVLDFMPTRDKNLERIVAELANQLSKLAAKLNIPIIAVSEIANDTENGPRSKYSGRIDYAAYAVLDVDRPQDEKTQEFGDLMTVTASFHAGGMRGTAKFYGKEKMFRLKNLGGGYGDSSIFKPAKGGLHETD